MTDNHASDAVVEKWIASLKDPEAVALDLIIKHDADKNYNNLPTVCLELYEQLRRLTELQAAAQAPPFLPDLYAEQVDAETVWGQVAQMNVKLRRVVNKSMTKLQSATEIQLLAVEDEEEQSQDERKTVSSDEDSEGSAHPDDEEKRRIRARMEKALEDMEDEDSHEISSEDGEENGSSFAPDKETASLVDPKEFETDRDAVNLHDGFFNLQEMEAFADEEEGYLPDEAFGQEDPEDNDGPSDKRSFHQKQRDGDMDIDESEGESDDDDNALTFRANKTARRKNFREDEDIDALYQLYEDKVTSKQVADDREDDAIHMTAADLFGKPNQKYYKRWNSKEREFKADSWGVFKDEKVSFGGHNTDWTDNGSVENRDKEDEVSEDEEIVPMKSANESKAGPKAYNKQSAKIIAQTEQLERELLAEKPWQMKGETISTARPVNSLLQTTPEFEVASKVAPEINMAFTENLEEAIKKRILEENWDDVVPRELPDVGWHSKRGEAPEVSQEKSKLSLGELYEREYLKKTAGYDVEAEEKETEEQKAKNEMKSLFANLCSKLDALSNYHFTPRPLAVEPEARPITQPAIAMEEVLPLHFNSERASAPEEVFGAKRGRDGILRAESELEQTDRKRLRRAKKAARRKARKNKLADEKLVSRLQPGNGLDNPYEKRRMQEELSVARSSGKVTTGDIDSNKYGDSTTFFKRMQQEAQATIARDSKSIGEAEGQERRGDSRSFKL